MASPRPVRIARKPAEGLPRKATDPDEAGRRFWDADIGAHGDFEPNHAGSGRAYRLYVMFGTALVFIFILFAALAATSPAPGVAHNSTVYAWLLIVTLFLGAVGAFVTILRAPKGATFSTEGVVITDRLGRRRRWPAPPTLSTRIVHRYPGGLLGFEATELVELSDNAGHSAQYLVGRGFFDRFETTG
ncbi:MAG: hypothetical protein L3K18_07785 [Thermoplasmata archaeon]|nr:hypothetical protein [Thermoplasmata archaeon]